MEMKESLANLLRKADTNFKSGEYKIFQDAPVLQNILNIELQFENKDIFSVRSALVKIFDYLDKPKTDTYMSPFFYYQVLIPDTQNLIENELRKAFGGAFVQQNVMEVLYQFFLERQ